MAPGVHRLPSPLPGDALKAVNVYVLEGSSGLTLVDAGMTGPEGWQALESGLASVGLNVRDISQILVTHIHGDHVGQATAIRRKVASTVLIGALERENYEELTTDYPATVERRLAYMEHLGARALVPDLRRVEERTALDWELPDGWISDGAILPAGRGQLEAVHTPGHTVGHVCFFDREGGFLFSGDHLLPHITPSIGFEPNPTGRALGDFLTSLARVRRLPADRILPAHGPVFEDLPRRVDELARHHSLRLTECRTAVLGTHATPFEVAQRLTWTRHQRSYEELDVFNRMLAVWETAAHLDLLEALTRVVSVEEDGILYFSGVDDVEPGSR